MSSGRFVVKYEDGDLGLAAEVSACLSRLPRHFSHWCLKTKMCKRALAAPAQGRTALEGVDVHCLPALRTAAFQSSHFGHQPTSPVILDSSLPV